MSQAPVHEDDYVADVPAVEFGDDDAQAIALDLNTLAVVNGSLDTTLPKAVDYLYATGGVEHLAETLDLLRAQRQRLAAAEAYVEAKCAQLAREQGLLHKGCQLPDGRPVEFKGGAERKAWDVDRVLARVTSKALEAVGMGVEAQAVDPDSGEMRRLREVVEAVRAEVVAVLPNGANSMRTTRMRQLGITPADYCETSKGRVTVHIAPKPVPAVAP